MASVTAAMKYLVLFLYIMVLGQTFGQPVINMGFGFEDPRAVVTSTLETTEFPVLNSAFVGSECATGLVRFNGICISID